MVYIDISALNKPWDYGSIRLLFGEKYTERPLYHTHYIFDNDTSDSTIIDSCKKDFDNVDISSNLEEGFAIFQEHLIFNKYDGLIVTNNMSMDFEYVKQKAKELDFEFIGLKVTSLNAKSLLN
jgi:hypothetical protein